MTRRLTAFTIALLLAGGAAHAAGTRDRLDAFTKDLKGLDGRFTQTVFDPAGKQRETSSGRVALAAPRLFRWEYAKPYPQLIVADGNTVWVYDPDLQQVTRRAQGGAEQDSPLTALIDPSKLDRDYIVSEAGSRNGLQWLQLKPKQSAEQSGFSVAQLGFDAKGLRRMQVTDALGQRTDVAFSGWKRNPTFAASTFRFVPPKGVDVVGEG